MQKVYIPQKSKRINGSVSRLAIVASRFNADIVKSLTNACLRTLDEHGVDTLSVPLLHTPGAFEIPVTAAKALIAYPQLDALITLGAIIRGETPHFDIIAHECARGIGQLALETKTPIIFGILTANTLQQALARASDDRHNRGIEFAHAALDMCKLMRSFPPAAQ
ncbi:MAG: 6,7-dimethyl-8-ribityllumazine synthase [Candidatus Eutrophobiaceae bacterium]